MSYQESLKQGQKSKNNENLCNVNMNINASRENDKIHANQQIISIEENEQLDVFPTTINNSGGSRISKAASALNPRKAFRKRSSTESAVAYNSQKIEPRTRRYSKPIIESAMKNSEKQNRLSKINEKRHTRLSQHILKYLQLRIEINEVKSFIITIEKQKTVEDLIHQIEAEYAFQFIFPNNNESGELKRDLSEPLLITNQQFECNAVMNGEGEILKYSDIVGEVFDMLDVVVCTNVYEETVPQRDKYGLYNNITEIDINENDSETFFDCVSTDQFGDDSSQDIMENKSEIKKTKGGIVKKHRQNHDKIYSLLPNPSLDERFQSILHNKITLNLFYTFCLKEYSVENLLFWLDVEIFQTVNKDQYELYSNYIYYTYVDNNAPLQINITEEIKSDINIKGADFTNPDILEIFDEAQEHIYIMLKICLYQKFELNHIFKNLQDYKKKNRKEYEKNRILGYYGNYYKPDYELIQEKLDYILAKKNEINDINFNGPETDAYQISYQNNWLTSAITQNVILNNNDELKNYMKTSERRIKEVKNMKLQKGKKLAKFFGEIVDVETLCQQVKKIAKEEEDYKNDSTMDLTTIKSKTEKKSVQNIKNEFDIEERKRLIRKNEKLNNVLGEALTEDQIKDIIDVDKRRKRMKYLQHFLYSQIDDKEIINEIKIEQEKAMADIRYERRTNKLKKYFGQAPPPDLINNKAIRIENSHRRSIISLTLLMSKENGIINLFNMVNDIEKREDLLNDNDINSFNFKDIKRNSLKNRTSTINEELDENEYDNINNNNNNNTKSDNKIKFKIDDYSDNNDKDKTIDDENESDDERYATPSRKTSNYTQGSIQDQNEIIYEYYEKQNMEYLVEKNIFSTLEESINEDITDPETKEGFKRQITYLRESFIKNSNNIRRMSKIDTSLVKDNTENIWKGSNLLKPMIDNETIVNRDYTDNNIADNSL